jgi:hypothetical protein
MKLNSSIVISLGLLMMPSSLQASESPINVAGKAIFYCGHNQKKDPATMIGVKGSDKVQMIVEWDQQSKINNRQRCEDAAKKFMARSEQGNFFLVPGKDPKTGKGLICGIASKTICRPGENILFSTNDEDTAKEITKKLSDAIKNRIAGKPIKQSSSVEAIDMQELINSIPLSDERTNNIGFDVRSLVSTPISKI